MKSKKTSMAMGSQDSALFAGTWNRTAIAEGLKRKVLRPYLGESPRGLRGLFVLNERIGRTAPSLGA